jgi:ParB family chromosome partitioning protein
MSDKKTKLGRNFADLMAENELFISSQEEIVDVKIADIVANPSQPRTVFDKIKLEELAKSIKQHGIIQPVIVKPGSTGYILVAGERRVKAAELSGLETVPAIIRNYNMKHLPELAMLENIQREDLTPIEEAIAFQNIINNTHITHKELAEKIGKSRVYVTNILGLLNLPTVVMDAVNNDQITMGHARALSKIQNIEYCLDLFDRVISEKLTVRELERIIREKNNKQKPNKVLHQNLVDFQSVLKNKVKHLKVTIKNDKVILDFKNNNQIIELINHLKGE